MREPPPGVMMTSWVELDPSKPSGWSWHTVCCKGWKKKIFCWTRKLQINCLYYVFVFFFFYWIYIFLSHRSFFPAKVRKKTQIASVPRVQCFLFPISVYFLIWFNRRLLCLHWRADCEAARRRRPDGLPASIAAARSLWRLNQVWLMLNKGSADKWNSQRAVMPTSLSSSSPCNCLSVSQQVSPEVAAAPLSGPEFYRRLGGKEVLSSESLPNPS